MKKLNDIDPTDTNTVIANMDNMLYGTLRRLCRPHRGITEEDIQDMAQQIRLHIASKSLICFDPARGNKLSSFLYVAIANMTKQLLRSHYTKHARRQPRAIDDTAFRILTDPRDTSRDDRIAAIAADIVEKPEAYMDDRAATVFRRMIDGENQEQIAKSLGCGTGFVSEIVAATRQIITNISLDDWKPRPARPRAPTTIHSRRLLGTQRKSIQEGAARGETAESMAKELGVSTDRVRAYLASRILNEIRAKAA